MSLKSLKMTHKSINFRITLWYLAIFSLSFLSLFCILYLYISSSLIREDHQWINSKLQELSSVYRESALKGLVREVELEGGGYYVRVMDAQGMTVFSTFPSKAIHPKDIKKADSGLFSSLIQKIDFRTYTETATTTMPDGFYLVVGKPNKQRAGLLERFRETFGWVVLFVLILGFGGGWLIAYRALSPIREIISTVRSIQKGGLGARVSVPKTGDELEELSVLFNGMLNRIETLIEAMRASLDSVAHDLRTPLTRLRNTAERAVMGRDINTCHEALADCLEETAQIEKLLNTLMDISEAEAGVMRLNKSPVALSSLIKDMVEIYSYVAEEKGVVIEFDAPGSVVVSADEGRLKQVLANLIDNAIKYTPSGGRVEIKAGIQDGYVFISVKDTGMGIPEDDCSRIWERLYRGRNAVSQKGLGLGLSLVRAVVQAHGGRVEVESAPGEGSVFTVYLPGG